MNNPQFLSIFSVVFLALAGYNLYTGYKRVRYARMHGVNIKWRKQINLLTGTEYLLLALVFLLSIEYKNPAVPVSLRNILLPLYLFFLLAAAVLAGLVIRQGILNTRALRAQNRNTVVPSAKSNGTSATRVEELETTATMSEQQRTAYVERRRERRRNAAAARRRRAGKA
jgi:hypothetical protein